MSPSATHFDSPAELRAAIRAGKFTGPTTGQAPGYVQANLVVVPESAADDFGEFCRQNAQACPALSQTAPGNPDPGEVAPGADLRTDVPRYRVYRGGKLESFEPTDVRRLWRGDLVAFLLGCSFTFESALQLAGLRVRHIDQQRNVPMYRTSLACRRAGVFAGPLVVSMRPFLAEQVPQVTALTRRFPSMHGAPVHVGDPAALGIADLARPDFGDPVFVGPGEVPVFWACGVTPQL
ncbi:MAG TPA: putative hydro-lyase, partial [Pirellulales bacterium]|nr:putative hydro-lyase [Pirellulales bacterium]